MGLIRLTSALLFAVLFAIAIISYVANFGTDNNSAVNLNQDAELPSLSAGLKENVSVFVTDINDSSLSFFKSEITENADNVKTGGSFKTGVGSFKGMFFSILKVIQLKIFGNDTSFSVIFSMASAFMVFIIGLYVWKTWKGGDPD